MKFGLILATCLCLFIDLTAIQVIRRHIPYNPFNPYESQAYNDSVDLFNDRQYQMELQRQQLELQRRQVQAQEEMARYIKHGWQ